MALSGSGQIGGGLSGASAGRQLPDDINVNVSDLIFSMDASSDDDVDVTFNSITGDYDASAITTTNVSSVDVYKNGVIQTSVFSLTGGDTVRMVVTRNDLTLKSVVTVPAV